MTTSPVAIIMGSQSDWDTMRHAAETLDDAGVSAMTRASSRPIARRTGWSPLPVAKASGFKVIIAGAGGAAHLPGMTAAMTRAAGVRRPG